MQRRAKGDNKVDKVEEELGQSTGALRNSDRRDTRYDKKYWNHRKREKQADGEISRFSIYKKFDG